MGGLIATKVDISRFTLLALLVQVVGLFFLGLGGGLTMTIVGAGFFGVSIGNLLMAQPLWLAEAFPADIYPRVYALSNALSVLGVALGPSLLGMLTDGPGYEVAYITAAGISIVAWVVLYSSGKGPSESA